VSESMRDLGIIFKAPMVRAILRGAKTQTRRVVTGYRVEGPCQHGIFDWYANDQWTAAHGGRDLRGGGPLRFARTSAAALCPYGVPGDRLWVRETLRVNEQGEWCYADGAVVIPPHSTEQLATLWGPAQRNTRPSIHMPRWASRITLEVTDVRVERLQQLTTAEAMAEGIPQTGGEAHMLGLHDLAREPGHEWDNRTSVENFARVWDRINGKRAPWAENPYVWVLSFKRMEATHG
jgi:hypothetical protein